MSESPMNVVVVGAGLAGAKAVEELRRNGYTGDITLIGAEPHRPYERPPLSKGLLLGTDETDSVFVHDAAWYAEQQVELLTGARVTGLDLLGGRVELAEREVPYDRLLLATGARPRRLPLAERSGADVIHLRTLDDSLALKPRLSEKLLIIGAGWIGLEVAAAAREAGGTVTVVETAALPLTGVLGVEIAALFAALHRDHGVDLRLNTSVETIEHTSAGTTVRLSDGHQVRPDLILVGIGVEPATELGAAAGLATDHGIIADASLRTSAPGVYAAGDVAAHDHPTLGRIRVEHWDTAIHHGRHAARSMLGDDSPYTRQPYFFTDQYDLGMEYIGHVGPDGYDEVTVRGDLDGLAFTALWTRGNMVVAGMQVNDFDATDALRSVVGQNVGLLARDPDVDLAQLAAAAVEDTA